MIAARRILSCVAVGDDLAVAAVTAGPTGAQVTALPTHRGFLATRDARAIASLRRAARGAEIVFTCPAHICGTRPLPLSLTQWRRSNADVLASLDKLLPVRPDDAEAGFIAAAPAFVDADSDSPEERGFLVAVRRDQLEAWTTPLAEAAGRPVHRVLSPAMAMLGLPLASAPDAAVIERTGPGVVTMYRFRAGAPDRLAEPWTDDRLDSLALGGVELFEWPTSTGDGLPGHRRAAPLSPADLAAAAALAPIAGAGRFAPVVGPSPRAPRRWIAPAALTAAAIGIIAAAGHVESTRFERAIDDLHAQRAAHAERLAAVEQHRRGYAQAAARLERALVSERSPARPAPRAALASLADAAETLPAGRGFLYEIALDDASVTVRGEAPRAGEVLGAVERADAFRAATQLDPPVAVAERGHEAFRIRADRAAPQDAAP